MRLHQAGWAITRISITDQLVGYCAHELLDFHCHRTPDGLRYGIDGEEFTPEPPADRFLGGYEAAFGRSGYDFAATQPPTGPSPSCWPLLIGKLALREWSVRIELRRLEVFWLPCWSD